MYESTVSLPFSHSVCFSLLFISHYSPSLSSFHSKGGVYHKSPFFLPCGFFCFFFFLFPVSFQSQLSLYPAYICLCLPVKWAFRSSLPPSLHSSLPHSLTHSPSARCVCVNPNVCPGFYCFTVIHWCVVQISCACTDPTLMTSTRSCVCMCVVLPAWLLCSGLLVILQRMRVKERMVRDGVCKTMIPVERT